MIKSRGNRWRKLPLPLHISKGLPSGEVAPCFDSASELKSLFKIFVTELWINVGVKNKAVELCKLDGLIFYIVVRIKTIF